MDAAELAKRIADVFGDLEMPAVLVRHQCPECESVQTAFEGRAWKDTPDEAVKDHHDSLPLLTPEAFVSLIPAYLRVAIREPLRGDIAPSVLYSLQPSANRRGCPFNPEQRSLLLEVAEWLAAQESWGIDMGRVRKYWSKQ
jgi:hypothetical protein